MSDLATYSVPCYTCKSKLIDEGPDDNGQHHLTDGEGRPRCPFCYRGRLSFRLSLDDEKTLLAQFRVTKEPS